MDHANRTIGDLQKSGKRLGEQVAEARDSVVGAEKKKGMAKRLKNSEN